MEKYWGGGGLRIPLKLQNKARRVHMEISSHPGLALPNLARMLTIKCKTKCVSFDSVNVAVHGFVSTVQ